MNGTVSSFLLAAMAAVGSGVSTDIVAAAAESEARPETSVVCTAGAIDGDLLWHIRLLWALLRTFFLVLLSDPGAVGAVPIVARVT